MNLDYKLFKNLKTCLLSPGFGLSTYSDFRMALKNGLGKCSLYVLWANGWKHQNMAYSFSRQRKPWYGEGIVRLANRVVVWRQSEVSVDFWISVYSRMATFRINVFKKKVIKLLTLFSVVLVTWINLRKKEEPFLSHTWLPVKFAQERWTFFQWFAAVFSP